MKITFLEEEKYNILNDSGKKYENFEESNNMTPQIMPQMLYKEMPCKRHDNSLQLAHMKKPTTKKNV